MRALQRSGWAAFIWVVVFVGFHVYWAVGGTFGFGDQTTTVPATDSPAKAVFAVVVLAMFAVGAVLPLAMVQRWGRAIPRRLLLVGAWAGAVLLVLRGAAGPVDTVLRESGLAPLGLTGLTYEQVTGDNEPTTYTLWSGVGIDLYFVLGGILYGLLAGRFSDQPSGVRLDDLRPTTARALRTSLDRDGA